MIRMEFSGLSVIEDRNLASSAVGYAYLGNGFLCTLCVLENTSPRHGQKRNTVKSQIFVRYLFSYISYF